MIWGYTESVALTSSTRLREFQDGKAVGANCPRLSGSTTDATLARQVGFKQWTAIIGSFRSNPNMTNLLNQSVAYAKAYPEAMIEWGNELNFSSMTAAQVATLHKTLYPQFKAQCPNTKVLLSSVGNGPSSVEHLLPLDWCAALAKAGCLPGKGFDIANFHAYALNPQNYDNWMHVWTPLSGRSCLSVLQNPKWLMTEYGLASDGSDSANLRQAQAVTAWMQKLRSLAPNCLGGMVYALSDDAPGSGTQPPHYGLRRRDLSHKPSWAAYKAQAY